MLKVGLNPIRLVFLLEEICPERGKLSLCRGSGRVPICKPRREAAGEANYPQPDL